MNRQTPENEMDDNVEIRLLNSQDGAAVARLAELDTSEPPPHPLLGGIIGGRLVAAHSLATGESVADPFRPTEQIRSLLARRAGQVSRGGHSRSLLGRLRKRLGGNFAAKPGVRSPFIPGTENTHLLPRGKGF
jgi:hypothetical protein